LLGTLLLCQAAETDELLKWAAGSIRALRLRFATTKNSDNDDSSYNRQQSTTKQQHFQQQTHSARWEWQARAQKSLTEHRMAAN